ncbi:hypothetical protein Pint_24209 [Pistacia integerrima]|uniref:Uncharacterized protein n=1 Tax=Pistacia integerrima TaxID=434235 RepID=A0ACC0YGE1_9ROSI|nr:hypothetical protein Pint_24209 [Pistacia integerrima]
MTHSFFKSFIYLQLCSFMAMANQLSAFNLLLILISLLIFTMNSEAMAVANKGEQVEQFKFAVNSEPVRPPIIHIHGHNKDGNALSVPPAAQNPAIGLEKVQGREGENTWCISKPSTAPRQLIDNINLCCDQPVINCSNIELGDCPNNIYLQASIVMNLYYKAMNKQPQTCDFQQTGLIVSQDPSLGECKFEE